VKEAPPVAHPDLDQLLNALLSFAKSQVSKHGSFLPFGATLTTDGEIRLAAAHFGDDELPDANALIDLLIGGFKKEVVAGAIRAAGTCVDVRVVPPGQSDKTDAICAQLEHVTGQCAEVFLPYKKGLLGRTKFGDLFAVAGNSRVFKA
jgi:hypothetical protein